MALVDKKLTELTEILSVPDNAFIHVVDPNDVSQSPQGSSYKAKKSTIGGAVKAQVTVSGTVKTNINNADPIVYLKGSVDALLSDKQDTLVNGLNIASINSQNLLNGGNIEIANTPITIDAEVIENSANAVSGGGVFGFLLSKIFSKISETTKIAIIGDSITHGVGSTSGDTSYADILNNIFNFNSYYKLGFSSMTVKPTLPRPHLSQKISDIPLDTNFITLMIGINDWAENNVIGDINTVINKTYESLDETLSFCEAFRYNLETIKIQFPDADIRVITPIKHGQDWVRDLDFKFYVEAQIQIANFLSIPVINVFDGCKIYIGSNILYRPDGIHPNDNGYNLIADFVKFGIIDNKTEHESNTKYNSLVVGRQDIISKNNYESIRLKGDGFNGGNDEVGGFSIGLFFNSAGNRYAYFGGSDSDKKLIFYQNQILSYDFNLGIYQELKLNTNGKAVRIGNSIGSGDLLNIGNFGFDASNILLGLFGTTSQSGDFIVVENVDSTKVLRLKANGNLLLGLALADTGEKLQVNGKIKLYNATESNHAVALGQLSELINTASATLTITTLNSQKTSIFGSNSSGFLVTLPQASLHSGKEIVVTTISLTSATAQIQSYDVGVAETQYKNVLTYSIGGDVSYTLISNGSVWVVTSLIGI
jgi:lysophospholipase L1-like esterase